MRLDLPHETSLRSRVNEDSAPSGGEELDRQEPREIMRRLNRRRARDLVHRLNDALLRQEDRYKASIAASHRS